MRWTRSLIPTLKEAPAEAEAVSHQLLVRGGFVRQLAAGIYVSLPLLQRVMERICTIIREEMNRIGGQEITMPVLHPAEIWQQSGRWTAIGPEMFRLRDRGERDMCLGMTHEEVIAWLAAKEVRSYRDLPQIWYQIQTKLRDEARPKGGILRTREFLMKDSYTLDRDAEGLEKSYALHKEAYARIFERCGLRFYAVESDPGMMGGAGAHEFMAPSVSGEDAVALCSGCGYAANVEVATSVAPPASFREEKREEVATPGARTIDEVSGLLKIPPARTLKSLLYVTLRGPLMVLLRGDQQLHEKKLAHLVGEYRPAHRDEIREITGAEAGSIGPVGLTLPLFADTSVKEGSYVAGANRDGYHLRGVAPGTDLSPRFADLHVAREGDLCSACGKPLAVERVIEVGNIFKLGTKYSEPMGATFVEEDGRERPIVMGSYGIGPARIAAAAVEQNHDADGIIWPAAIAPCAVHLVAVNMKEGTMTGVAEQIDSELATAGVSVLYDDRDERPGVKFKDADLLGIPLRVTVGTRFLKEGKVEIRTRKTREEAAVIPSEVLSTVRRLVPVS